MKTKPGSHQSLSLPHSKQRRPNFWNDWPVGYAQIQSKKKQEEAQHLAQITPLYFITLSKMFVSGKKIY